MVELSSHLGSEQPSGTSRRHGPGLDILRIRPHEIAEWAFVRDFHSSVDKSNLINCFDFWRKTSVNTENFSLNNGTDAEVVENFCAVFPWVSISILSNGLVIKSIHGGDLSGFVVSSEQSDVSWILELEAEQKLECLNRIITSVDKVSHEDVSCIWDLSSLIE
jgi:hypothetical protein